MKYMVNYSRIQSLSLTILKSNKHIKAIDQHVPKLSAKYNLIEILARTIVDSNDCP